MRKPMILLLTAAALVFTLAAVPQASAQTGTLLAGPFAPIGEGNGRGMAFDGVNLYITRTDDSNIYKITPPLPTGPVTTISVLSGVSTGVSFPDPQVIGFEDLESDRITFAPKCALWGTTAGQPTVAAYQIPCAVLAGRMNGGGSVFTSAGVRVTHGFELHCKTT